MDEMRTRESIRALVEAAASVSLDEQLSSSQPLAIELNDPDAPWLLSIGGLNQRMGMPVHEFAGITRGLDVVHNRLFVRDLSRLWYQAGLPGLTGGFVDTGEFLGLLLDELGATRRVAVGSSAGGFAALGWARSARFDRVLVFSPQSSIAPAAKAKDRRWMKFIWKSWFRRERCLDVAAATFSGESEVHVIYPTLLPADRFQAERIERHGRLRLDGRDSAEHSVVRELKETGELHKLLRGLLVDSPEKDDGRAQG